MTLRANDLRDLVKEIFEIDSYSSKMGEDSDVSVLSFEVDIKEAANDLVNFIEKGFGFVLDADVSPGELDDGKYKVFVEIQRDSKLPSNIMEIVDGVKKLTGIENLKFRYHRNFDSIDATEDSLNTKIPKTAQEYTVSINENYIRNYKNFFHKTLKENIVMQDNNLIIKKSKNNFIRFELVDHGPINELTSRITGAIQLESKAVAENLYLIKHLGDYNIHKIGNLHVLESLGYGIAVKLK